jgi:hypothetical protein
MVCKVTVRPHTKKTLSDFWIFHFNFLDFVILHCSLFSIACMMRRNRNDDEDSVISSLSTTSFRPKNGGFKRQSNSPQRGKTTSGISDNTTNGGSKYKTKASVFPSSPGRKKTYSGASVGGSLASLYTAGTSRSHKTLTLLGRESTPPGPSATNSFVNTNRDPMCLALRKRVIQGDFMNGSFDSKGNYITTSAKWGFKQWQMLVFLSSTFTDTRLERNILLNDILPELRDEAIQSDIEVTFVDMRWGIRDEHTLKHQTWAECQKELQRCRDESCGLFFLSLQSEKYGYRPLPRTIDQHAFERAVCAGSQEIKDLAKTWFQFDANSIPPHYVLRDLDSLTDSSFWDNALPKLRDAFVGIRFDKSMTTNVILGRSISEWEAKYSLTTNEDVARSLWVHRSFNDNVDNQNFADTTQDPQVNSKLKDLKKWINLKIKKISPQRIHNYEDISFDSFQSEQNDDFEAYTKAMKNNTLEALQSELRNIIQVKKEFDADGCTMNLPGHFLEEFLHHANWAHNLCSSFISREHLVEEGLQLAKSENKKFEDSRDVEARSLLSGGKAHKYKSLSFMVMGAPGVGKSAFMAVLANELFKLNKSEESSPKKSKAAERKAKLATPLLPKRLVLIRFCGTGDGTTSAYSLVSSLLSQIEYCLNPSKPPRKRSKVSTFRTFRELVNAKPVVIIIDGIDKIVGGVEIFETMSIHHDTRIILSATALKDQSGMTLFAFENDVPSLNINPFTTMSNHPANEEAEIAVIVDETLRRKARKLSRTQRAFVLEKLESDPRAIYLSLVLREVDKWQSFEVIERELNLESLTSGIMCQILDKVELDCGVLMSRLAIGCLTLSVNGINDIEMEDLVSLNSEVLYAVFQYDYPKIWRLPSHVWLRLRNSLIGLIVERQRGCLHWHHEELQVIADRRFTSKDEKENIHRTLGTYFSNRVHSETMVQGRITMQPLRINGISPFLVGTNINTRRCNEGAYHLIEGGMYNEAVEEMCNIEYVAACVISGEGCGMVSRFKSLVGHFERMNADDQLAKTDEVVTKRLNDYYHWINLKFDAISIDSPVLLLTVTASMEPVDSCVRLDLIDLVKATRNDTEVHKYSEQSWIRGITLHNTHSGSNETCTNSNYKTYNSCAVWSPDNSRIALCVGSETVDIWDSKELSVKCQLVCPSRHSILQLSWACDNNHLAISTRVEVFIWNCDLPITKIPLLIKTLGVHGERFNVARFSPTAYELACGSPQRTVTLWGGAKLTLQNTYTISKMSSKFSKQRVALPDIADVRWSRDGEMMSALTVGNLRVWDRSDLVTKATFTPAQGSRILSCDFSPDGKRIVTTSEDGKVTVWNTLTTAQHSVFDGHRDSVKCVSWHKNGLLIATGSKDGIVLIWNVQTGQVLQHLFGHYHDIHELSWSPNGLQLLSASSNDHYIRWDSTKRGGKTITKT